ncbi:acetylornithine deacetylase [Marivita sp. S6314]|uniref:acetylornithine deacetylase n=1 Tax=Marivita sp. S6314 TaxID=2926406 RepID=UPI001FF54369|nr:acetylornithine deacetylase [Marivita sp. S6314]MCK0150668.1 acetylornithine deacetylase [Marivita sp. S6314]
MSLTLETLETLVGFDTVSAKPNVDIIRFIEDFLRTRGARCVPLPSKQAGKLGLYAEIGPRGPHGILLSAHTDVVPVTGQTWTRAPFSLSREGDRVFGRGTTDMKGYVACMLHAADRAARADLNEPLKLLFSYDEEIGCVGIQEMIGKVPSLVGTPRACFVGEPTEMQVAIGHKGKAALEAVCTGQAGHSSLAPHFVNALHMAADMVIGLRDLQDWFAQNGERDDGYDVPYSTIHVGKLSGGVALNIVPDQAKLTFEYRHLAADAPTMIMARIKELADRLTAQYQRMFDGADICIKQINAYPGLDTPETSHAAQLALRTLRTSKPTKVAFGTEAGFFDALGIPTVVCGPGNMAGQGHKADEFIELGQLAACDALLAGIIEELGA